MGSTNATRLKRMALLALALGLAGTAIALAQPPAGSTDLVDGVDFGRWFADRAALAGVIIGVITQIRKRWPESWPNLDGFRVVIASVILGGVLGLFGHFAGFLTDGFLAALGFGIGAGVTASLGVDVFRTLLGRPSGSTPPGTGTLPS